MTLVPEVTLPRAAAEAELFNRFADVVTRGLAGQPGIRQLVISRARREIVVVADDYTSIAMRDAA